MSFECHIPFRYTVSMTTASLYEIGIMPITRHGWSRTRHRPKCCAFRRRRRLDRQTEASCHRTQGFGRRTATLTTVGCSETAQKSRSVSLRGRNMRRAIMLLGWASPCSFVRSTRNQLLEYLENRLT